jgi:hypothetical protein
MLRDVLETTDADDERGIELSTEEVRAGAGENARTELKQSTTARNNATTDFIMHLRDGGTVERQRRKTKI